MVEVVFTKHAEDMLVERKISKNEIISVIENPGWEEQIDEEIWYAFKKVQNKVLRVVIKEKEEPYTVITLFYDRRLRSRK
ncbi:MAG: DUF4258 domain-containing protein [ANME-2 cluster archaeon]|nr:DUF4258 domain-containing protein [ANME-2 cluster archaeon]